MKNIEKTTPAAGMVWLVGAGPGDEGLISVKGSEVIKKASVVVYDNLVNEKLLKYCRDDCEKIFVGKMSNNHTLSQEEINKLLVSKAQEGHRVVRLKGGDPYIFGRGGEEVLALDDEELPFEVIPGITAASGGAAYAGIPLTHRGLTSQLTFITGHEKPGKEASDLDWKQLATCKHTLAIYMGVGKLPFIISSLKENGISPDTPVALIRYGTYNHQETVFGTVDDIVGKVKKAGLKPPAIIIIGRVVELREKMRWFDKRPLCNKRIVVTRSRTQASSLSKMLEARGAGVIELPTIIIEPVADYSPLLKTFEVLNSFSWIIFTSTNSVSIFFEKLFSSGRDSRALYNCKLAAIGKETARFLMRYGLAADLVPKVFTSEGTVAAFKEIKNDYSNDRILFPGSNIARDLIPSELEKMGAEILRVSIYNTVMPDYTGEYLSSVFDPLPDAVTFTSSSTVSNLASLLKENGLDSLLEKIPGVSIGPVTTDTALKCRISVIVDSPIHTIRGLVDSVIHYFKEKENI